MNVLETKRNTKVYRKILSIPKWGRNLDPKFKFEFIFKRKKKIGSFLVIESMVQLQVSGIMTTVVLTHQNYLNDTELI